MSTRAKFKCTEVSKREGYGENKIHYSATLLVVNRSSDENKSFFASTPAGRIEISTIRVDLFEVGQEYYVDFTAALVPTSQGGVATGPSA